MNIFTSRALWVVSLSWVISGCTVNPVVSWTPPARTGQPATNLDYADSYAQTVQDAYKKEIGRQAGMSLNLSTGLVTLGALTLAIASGSASKDAVASLALIGGTGYALGGMTLSKQRLLILMAGQEAVACARRAVIPMRMTDTERIAIEKSLDALDVATPTLDATAARLRIAFAEYRKAGQSDTSSSANRALSNLSAVTTLSAAITGASSNGRVLVTQARQAGDRLIAAVDKIDAAVVRASVENLPDLASVVKIVSGLAGFASQIAPGASVDKFFAAGIAKQDPTLKSDSVGAKSPAAALDDASLALENAMLAAQTELRIVQSYLSAYQAGPAVLDALKDCGVTDVYFPLKASVEKLVFATGADATKSFVLAGGVKPYVVEMSSSAIAGLTLKGPAPFESRVQLSLSKEVTKPQSASVLVMDSSNPMKTLELPITIGETPVVATVPLTADTNANTATDTAGGTTNAENEKQMTAMLNEFNVLIGKTQVTSGKDARVSNGTYSVSVVCQPSPPKCYPHTAFRDTLLEKLSLPENLKTLGSKVTILPSSKCVCAN